VAPNGPKNQRSDFARKNRGYLCFQVLNGTADKMEQNYIFAIFSYQRKITRCVRSPADP